MAKKYQGPGGFTLDTGDVKTMVYGWGAFVLSVATAIAIWQLSAAIAASILILSGAGGCCMLIWTSARAYAGIMLAKANAERIKREGKAAMIEARNRGRLGDGS